jgi:predicted glutamine amidotransferase
MCRWIAYLGGAIRPYELLYEPEHSLIRQSRSSKLYDDGVNGDGFGLGWYGKHGKPGLYRSTAPAWSDRNLRELSSQIEAEVFLAHVRATTGTAVQETNCHPFRYRRWIFVHNGFLEAYERVRRELLFAVHPSLFMNIEGSTDSELLFHLALTFGLDEQPLLALERMAGFVEAVGDRSGIAEPLQMTIGLSDGETVYAVRYASGATVNSLFVSASVEAVRALYPERERLQRLPGNARAIVSEPLANLPGAWLEVPVSTAFIVRPSAVESVPFMPIEPDRHHLAGSTAPRLQQTDR